MHFDKQSFQKIVFSHEQILQHYNSAKRDLEIAQKSNITEVIFKFTYDALIKLGITLIAKEGFKIRSRTGHHIKIIEKLTEILNNENISIFGNKMRQDRNLDLYSGGGCISQSSSLEYLHLVKAIFQKAEKIL